MKYINAAEVLPKSLLLEIQKHINGEVLYIPNKDKQVRWGEKNGSRLYFENRNKQIKQKHRNGCSLDQISLEYGLAYDTVRKIIYKK